MEPASQAKELVVGKYYLVDSVLIKKTCFTERITIPQSIIPVLGPLHSDPEIKFDFNHIHVDWRFIEEKLYKKFLSITSHQMPWERVIHSSMVIPAKLAGGEYLIGQRAMKCKREFKLFPKPSWLRALEKKYANTRMKDFICPHKGLPCNALPIAGGVVICRGHGLAWEVETGKLVLRTPLPQPKPLSLED